MVRCRRHQRFSDDAYHVRDFLRPGVRAVRLLQRGFGGRQLCRNRTGPEPRGWLGLQQRRQHFCFSATGRVAVGDQASELLEPAGTWTSTGGLQFVSGAQRFSGMWTLTGTEDAPTLSVDGANLTCLDAGGGSECGQQFSGTPNTNLVCLD